MKYPLALLILNLVPAAMAANPYEHVQEIADVGGVGISGTFAGPLVRIRSTIFIPGQKPIDHVPVKTHECNRPDSSVIFKVHMDSSFDLERACDTVHRASDFITSDLSRGKIFYEIHVIPEMTRLLLDSTRWGWNRARISLAVPWFDDPRKRYGNLADLVAHETYHVVATMTGNSDPADEYRAYYFGLCGQLRANHLISVGAAPGSALDGTVAVRESSSAAQTVRTEISSHFENGLILEKSPAAGEILAKCTGDGRP